MRKTALVVSICLFLYCRASAQTMDNYTHQLLFNVFTGNADTSISGFLKLYLPVLYGKKRSIDEWTNFQGDTSHVHNEMHSFMFTKHPYFREKFANGRLDIFCKRYENGQLLQNITGVQLWFEFDLLEEAEIAFTRLIELFILSSTDKKISAVNGAQRAAFINLKDKTGFYKVQLKLMADNAGAHKFRILFEPGNDMK